MKNAIIFIITACFSIQLKAQTADTLDWQSRCETRVTRAKQAAQMACDSTLPLKIRVKLYQNFVLIYEKSEQFLPSFQSFQRIATESDERTEMEHYMKQLSLREARLYELEDNYKDMTGKVQNLQTALLLRQNR